MGLSHPNLYLFIFCVCPLLCYLFIVPPYIFLLLICMWMEVEIKFSRTALLSSLLMGDGVMDGKIILLWLLFG